MEATETVTKKTSKKTKSKSKKTTRATGTIEAGQDAYEKFVQVWNAAESKGDVVTKTGLSATKVSMWSYNLRKQGVPLKKFKTKPTLDIKKLTELAKKALN